MTKDKTNIEEIKLAGDIQHKFLMGGDIIEQSNAIAKWHKDQVRAECEEYLDEFVKYVFGQPMNQKLWHEYVETFKKEQSEKH